MNIILNLIIFAGVIYIIFDQFFKTKEEHLSEEDFDRIVQDKARLFGSPVKQSSTISKTSNVSEHVKQIQSFLEWGSGDIASFLNQHFFNSQLSFELKAFELESLNWRGAELDFKKELFEYLISKSLKSQKKVALRNSDFFNFKLNLALIVGLGLEVFKTFDGSRASIIDFNHNENISVDNVDQFIEKLIRNHKSIDVLFLLKDSETNEIKAKMNKKEIARDYHPDKINLNIIPENYREKFFKLYSDQFARLIS